MMQGQEGRGRMEEGGTEERGREEEGTIAISAGYG